MSIRRDMEALLEKSSPPKPPGEGWQMVFGRWVQTGFQAKEKSPKGLRGKIRAKAQRTAEKLTAAPAMWNSLASCFT